MGLGKFSVSLSVRDINKSKEFYESLGFNQVAGEIKENWIIMSGDNATIGLFQGMFPKNLMTFNPGWDYTGQAQKDFTDIRQIQAKLKKDGLEITDEADKDSTGPASFMTEDPDGNQILFDQHV